MNSSLQSYTIQICQVVAYGDLRITMYMVEMVRKNHFHIKLFFQILVSIGGCQAVTQICLGFLQL